MNIFNSVTKMVADAGGALADAASQASDNALKTAVAAGETIGNAASSAGQVVTGTVAGVGEAVGSAALTAGQSAVEIATKTSSEVIEDCSEPSST